MPRGPRSRAIDSDRIRCAALVGAKPAKFALPRMADVLPVTRIVPAEAWIDADGRRVEQVLDNLMANAMRYVPRGGTVELSLDRPAEHAECYRLVVSDDGPGLPEEDLTRVFERFYRSPGHRAGTGPRDDLGSGLGLAIVREIVQRHGGRVRAEARYPRGISIVVELPARG